MADITLEGVGKVYPGGTRAVEDFSLHIEDGEFVVLVGPSGCGKSTILRMVAGLEDITDGTVRIGDRVVNGVPPKDRDIAMVFQNYALYPHMSVRDNLAFALRLRGMGTDEIRERVTATATMLEIGELLDRKPSALSGGQRQRVAMGRAIVREPAAFLMDEPLSNLDAKLRVQMRSQLGRLHARLHTTTLYVTHDQTEAMTMGNRVAVIRKGTLQQVDTPRRLYEQPVNLFVAGFIGSPAMNFVSGTVTAVGGAPVVRMAEHEIRVPPRVVPAGLAPGEVVIGIRPEAFEVAASAGEHDPTAEIPVTVSLVEQLGSEAFVHFSLPVPPVVTPDIRELLEDQGADPSILGTSSAFIARVDPDRAPSFGSVATLVVDTSKLLFFDPETSEAIR